MKSHLQDAAALWKDEPVFHAMTVLPICQGQTFLAAQRPYRDIKNLLGGLSHLSFYFAVVAVLMDSDAELS